MSPFMYCARMWTKVFAHDVLMICCQVPLYELLVFDDSVHHCRLCFATVSYLSTFWAVVYSETIF